MGAGGSINRRTERHLIGFSPFWHGARGCIQVIRSRYGFLRCHGTLATSTRQFPMLRESRPRQECAAERSGPDELVGIPEDQQGQQVEPVSAAAVTIVLQIMVA